MQYLAYAAIVGAALGWLQFGLLRLANVSRRPWVIAVKLLLWALTMVAAAWTSVAALLALVVSASCVYLIFAFIQWHELRKGE